MFLKILVRRLASTLAFPAAFAVPFTAVAHGHAHEHAVGHLHHGVQADDHHELGTASGMWIRGGMAAFAHGPDAQEHQHPKIDATVTSRVAPVISGAVPALVELPFVRILAVLGARGPFVHPRVRAHGTHAPPPSLRSPPATIT